MSTYADNNPTPRLLAALKVELNAAYDNGGRDVARLTAMKLKTLQVNAKNERLTAESFREVATGILDDMMAELERIANGE